MPHKPEPLPAVRGTNVGRGVQTPFRIEPEFGKVTENMGKSCTNNSWDVLQEHVAGFHVADDPCDVGPEPTVVVSSQPLPSRREGLAGETGSDEIHSATPCSTVERGEVRPDRSPIQARLVHPRHESGRCVGVPLNVSHGSGVSSECELEAAISATEVQGT